VNALAEHPNPVPGERQDARDCLRAISRMLAWRHRQPAPRDDFLLDAIAHEVNDLARAAGQFEAEFARLTRPDRAELPAAYRGTDPLEAIDHYIEEQRVKLRRHEGNWHREAQIEALEVCRQRVAAALARRESNAYRARDRCHVPDRARRGSAPVSAPGGTGATDCGSPGGDDAGLSG